MSQGRATATRRGSDQHLSVNQRAQVERLEAQMVDLHHIVEQILALGDRLEGQTIETLLAKSDAEVGLEWLLRQHDS